MFAHLTDSTIEWFVSWRLTMTQTTISRVVCHLRSDLIHDIGALIVSSPQLLVDLPDVSLADRVCFRHFGYHANID